MILFQNFWENLIKVIHNWLIVVDSFSKQAPSFHLNDDRIVVLSSLYGNLDDRRLIKNLNLPFFHPCTRSRHLHQWWLYHHPFLPWYRKRASKQLRYLVIKFFDSFFNLDAITITMMYWCEKLDKCGKLYLCGWNWICCMILSCYPSSFYTKKKSNRINFDFLLYSVVRC